MKRKTAAICWLLSFSASVLFASDDMAEGYKAMAAKAKPRFEGK